MLSEVQLLSASTAFYIGFHVAKGTCNAPAYFEFQYIDSGRSLRTNYKKIFLKKFKNAHRLAL